MLHLRGRRGGAYVTGEVIMATVTIQEAAQHLGVSQDTVRRRIRKEELQATQTPTPQGFRWVVELEDLVARRREVQELHVLLQQKALPEAVGRSWWWRLWSGR